MVVWNIFYVHPYLGRIPILTNIFQVGWNHQLDKQFVGVSIREQKQLGAGKLGFFDVFVCLGISHSKFFGDFLLFVQSDFFISTIGNLY